MRPLIVSILLLAGLYSASAQFEINGPATLYCPPVEAFYEIDPINILTVEWYVSGNIADITWTSNGILVLFPSPGVYLITALALQDSNTIVTVTKEVTVLGVNPQDVLWVDGCNTQDIDSLCHKVCAHSTSRVYYTTGEIPHGWTVSGADNYSVSSPETVEITWGAGGTGSVSAETQCGTAELCFDILPLPVADFTASPTATGDTLTVCRGQEIFFENTSENALRYQWTFGDGEESTEHDAYHAFSSEGTYAVTLSAESICDCADEQVMIVNVLSAAAPELDCVNSICPGGRQHYTAMTDGCSTFDWSVSGNGTVVDGGGPDDDFIDVIWHSGPDGFVHLSVGGCNTTHCSSGSTFRIPVISPDGPISGDQEVCASELVNYEVPHFPGTEYNWSVASAGTIVSGYGSNSIAVQWANVSAVTSSSVSVSYDNCFLECGGQATLPVQITPRMRIAGDYQVCAGGSATVSAEAGFGSATPAQVEWQVQDEAGNVLFSASGTSASLSHTFSYPPGNYYWVAVHSGAAYCNPSARQRITVTPIPPLPLGISSADKICPGIPYGFTVDPAGTYASQWTVTDGITTTAYTGASITHTFGATPPYLVEVAHADVQFPQCASAAIQKELTAASFDEISGNGNVCSNTIETYSVERVTGTDYTWEVIPAGMGEIRKGSDHEIDVFWTSAGMATLRLQVCNATVEKEILVHPLPQLDIIGIQPVCSGAQIWISTDQPGMSHTWYDESGNVVGTSDSAHINAGVYAVAVTDANGCTTEKPFEIPANPSPEVQITTPEPIIHCGNIGGGIPLVANTDGAGYTFTWYMNGVDVGHHDPIYGATDFGIYQVYVTNAHGCVGISNIIEIEDCCPVSACIGEGPPSLPAGCTLIDFDFVLETTGLECNEKTYAMASPDFLPGLRWKIYSHATASVEYVGDTVMQTYALPGYYNILVWGQIAGHTYTGDECGHLDILRDTVRAVADFTFGRTCAGAPVQFENLTTYLPGEMVASWAWNFDDPASGPDNTSSLRDPIHVFTAAGSYDVTLSVTLASGCVTSITRSVVVSAGPELNPEYSAVSCVDEATLFWLPDPVFDIQWQFDDPASGAKDTASADSVMHTFQNTGIYNVTVSATDHLTCRATEVIPVDIRPNTLTGTIAIDPGSVVCQGDTVTLTAPAGGSYWLWSNEETAESTEVSESGQYGVFMRDDYNCPYSPPAEFIEVAPKPSLIVKAREVYGPEDFGPWEDALQLCYGTPYQLWAFATGNAEYQWEDGSVSQSISFTLESGAYPAPGTHDFDVYVTDPDNGCISDTARVTVEIYALPDRPEIMLVGGTGCSFNDNILEIASPQSGVEYIWSDGQRGTSVTVTTTGNYTVEAITPNGCRNESDTHTIKPSAPMDRMPGGCYIACDPLEVCLPFMGAVTSYNIYRNGTLLGSGTTWPSDFTIDQDGSYTFEITTANGCVATSDPLDVTLYQGVGAVTVLTYEDIDGDGVISAADVLLDGIPVQITSGSGQAHGNADTGPSGTFDFTDVPADTYIVSVDRDRLPAQWQVLIDSLPAEILTCDDSVTVSLLLTQNCQVPGAEVSFAICPGEVVSVGDSTWADTGTYSLHLKSQVGCDSIVTVQISRPDSFTVVGQVWLDVDENGILSSVDTLVPGIALHLEHLATGGQSTLVTDPSGSVIISIPADGYELSIDAGSLPGHYAVVISSGMVTQDDCGTIVIDLLLREICTPTTVIEFADLCPGDSILIDGQWQSSPGVYSYVSSDPGSVCDTVTDVHVSVSSELSIAGTVDIQCADPMGVGTIALDITGEGPLDVTWTGGINGDSLITSVSPGTYTVTVQDTNGCIATADFTVDTLWALSFDTLPSLFTILEGDTVVLEITGDTSTPGTAVSWDRGDVLSCDGCFSPDAFPGQSTPLEAVITDANGCEYVLSTFIEVIEDTTSIYVPNVFSPNDDGRNDHFTVYSNDPEAHIIEFAVFDRWGNLMYRADNTPLAGHPGWDGTFEGRSMANQVCVYYIMLEMGDGGMEVLSGDVLVLR